MTSCAYQVTTKPSDLMLCTAKNDRIVRYALGRSTSPMAVSGYKFTELPPDERALLPGEDELVEVVQAAMNDFDDTSET